ncbi:peptidoglycan D,D-transpeptidase FtsI family protein [Antribacter gilvus]|uniref:peptidoglycan D,D-transpeptidase FtsI family protein n=1 Tax=Antribacter gilvus TaxID=2304675 RepID=UPI000F77BB98|nr:penicillin-binding protein 2 [Antribacter gilvus]
MGLQAPPRRPAPSRRRVARPTPRLRRPGNPDVRQRWLIGLAALVVLLFVGRLVQVQVFLGPALAQDAQEKRLATTVTPAHRGDITDVNGVVLATSVDRYTVVADQRSIQSFSGHNRVDADGQPVQDGALGIAQLLGPVLGTPKAELAAKLSGDSGYVVLAPRVVPEVQRAIADLRIRAYVRTDLVSQRAYPSGTVAGSLVGYIDAETQSGQGGVEKAYDDVLAGEAGSVTFEQSRDGQQIPTGDQETVLAVPGQDVRLTLVHDVQWKAQDSIDQAVSATGAEYGVVVVQDVRTGEMVALADSGSVDPNDRTTDRVAEGSRAVKDLFEPGSTGKVITMAAALERGYWTPESQFTVPDRYTASSGQTFRDSHDHPVQQLTLTGILAESSNTGTVMVGEKIPVQVRYDYLRKFGFGEVSGLGLPGESKGLLSPAESWDARTKDVVLFGQGVSVNAIQATSVFSTVANGGVRMAPTLLEGTVAADGTLVPAERPSGKRVVSEETAGTLLHMMESVVDGGTGSDAAVPGYRVAGKTGTAQLWLDNGGVTFVSSFIGVAPAEDPRYTVSVFLKSPRTSIFGGEVAAPVFRDVMGFTLQKMDVPPSREPYTPLPTTW